MKYLLTTMRKLYRNSRISTKLFLAFSLMIAIPAIVVSFYSSVRRKASSTRKLWRRAAIMSHA